MQLGLIANERNDHDDAIKHYGSALKDASSRQDQVQIYSSKCRLAKCFGLLENFNDCEALFKEALEIFHKHKLCANENVSLIALSGLMDLYIFQERSADLEKILLEELDFNHAAFGNTSPEFLGIYNTLANVYTRRLQQPEKALIIYEFIIDYEKNAGKLTALGETLQKYAEALSLTGRAADAAEARAEQRKVQERIRNASLQKQRPFIEIKRDELQKGKITAEQFRSLALEEVASRAMEEEPILEEYNQMLGRHGCPPHEVQTTEPWKVVFGETVKEFAFSDEEITATARNLIQKLEENLLSWNSSWG